MCRRQHWRKRQWSKFCYTSLAKFMHCLSSVQTRSFYEIFTNFRPPRLKCYPPFNFNLTDWKPTSVCGGNELTLILSCEWLRFTVSSSVPPLWLTIDWEETGSWLNVFSRRLSVSVFKNFLGCSPFCCRPFLKGFSVRLSDDIYYLCGLRIQTRQVTSKLKKMRDHFSIIWGNQFK